MNAPCPIPLPRTDTHTYDRHTTRHSMPRTSRTRISRVQLLSKGDVWHLSLLSPSPSALDRNSLSSLSSASPSTIYLELHHSSAAVLFILAPAPCAIVVTPHALCTSSSISQHDLRVFLFPRCSSI